MKPRKVRRWAVADCETDPFAFRRVVTPFIWGFYDGEDYREFHSTEDFAAFVSNFDGIVYMHNGGKFDALFLLPWIRGKVLQINGRIASAQLGKADIRDSYCILPIPLRAFKKDEFDYSKLEPENREKYAKEISDYLRADCLYLHEIVGRFIDEYGQHITLASAAMDLWTRKFSPPIRYPKGDNGRRWFDRFSQYYTGGRVQCFQGGEINTDFSVWDINSAYPFAMSGEVPWGFGTLVTKRLLPNRIHAGFFIVSGTSFGAFPVRGSDGKLRYPDNHRGKFYVPGTELAPAMATGLFKLDRVERAEYFEQTATFKDYCDFCYNGKAKAKRDGDAAAYLFFKLLANGLYGKFGANPGAAIDNPGGRSRYRQTYIVTSADVGEYRAKGWGVSLIAPGQYLVDTDTVAASRQYYNVATAAAITGAVRGMLIRAVASADTPIYCDTDSIAAKSAELELGDKLGQWDLEANCDYAAVGGKKLYAFHKSGREWNDRPGNWKIACKGARLRASQIRGIARGGATRFESESPTFGVTTGQRFLQRLIRKTS